MGQKVLEHWTLNPSSHQDPLTKTPSLWWPQFLSAFHRKTYYRGATQFIYQLGLNKSKDGKRNQNPKAAWILLRLSEDFVAVKPSHWVYSTWISGKLESVEASRLDPCPVPRLLKPFELLERGLHVRPRGLGCIMSWLAVQTSCQGRVGCLAK